MKEFDLSDKELKSLLQEDGIESPSMGFNKSILSKIDSIEKTKATAIKAPKWLIFGLMILFIAPAVFFLAIGTGDLNSLMNGIEIPTLSFDLTFNTTYVWVGVLIVGVISMAMLFDKFFLNSSDRSS
jgi:hypothetical protein